MKYYHIINKAPTKTGRLEVKLNNGLAVKILKES